jgi:hypothetical protein
MKFASVHSILLGGLNSVGRRHASQSYSSTLRRLNEAMTGTANDLGPNDLPNLKYEGDDEYEESDADEASPMKGATGMRHGRELALLAVCLMSVGSHL